MNIAHIIVTLAHTRGTGQHSITHGHKVRGYLFFKNAATAQYQRVYKEGDTDPNRGTFPMERANEDIRDLAHGYDVKDTGLCVQFETEEEVAKQREEAEKASAEAEAARVRLAEQLLALEQSEREAAAARESLERGGDTAEASPKPKKPPIRTGKPLNIGA
jgi:hypothetical protein